MSKILAVIAAWFAPVAGSIKGSLIISEIKKAIIAGLAGSSLASGVAIALNTLAADAPNLTTSPAVAALAGFILSNLAAQVLMLGQGQDSPPNPVGPTPTPRPTPVA